MSRNRPALAALLVVGWMVHPGRAAAQSILNVEQLQPREVQGAHAASRLALDISGGNTEVVDIELSGSVGYRSALHWIRLLAGVEFLSQRGSELDDNRFAHARYNYVLTQRVRTFHFVQIQTARNLLLRRRVLLGSGLRFRVLARETLRLDLGSGLMYQLERLDSDRLDPGETVSTNVLRIPNMAVLYVPLREGLELQNVAYFQPSVERIDDFRVLSDLSFGVRLGARFALVLALRWRHDSGPPSGVEEDDIKLSTGLTLSYP